jgi:outer membrane protein TolC
MTPQDRVSLSARLTSAANALGEANIALDIDRKRAGRALSRAVFDVETAILEVEQLEGAVEALHESIRLARDFNRGAMTWQEYDRKLAALEVAHPPLQV